MNKIEKKLKEKKLNNRGDTLVIVLIGIFVLGILGTLILNITAINYKMRVADAQNTKGFYYAEKAVDEIYAGIGNDVMDSMSKSYQSVLESLLEKTGSSYTSLDTIAANQKFKDGYLNGIKVKYKDTDIDAVIATLSGYIKNVSGVTFNVKKLELAIDGVDTQVIYNANDTISIKNVCVTSEMNSGYYASITTDFEIGIPNVSLSFADSSVRDYGELFSYSIIADGSNGINSSTSAVPTISIKGKSKSKSINISGNVFSGSDTTKRKVGLDIGSNTLININSNNFVSAGSIKMRNAVATFGGLDGKNLQLWAHDLITENITGNINSNELTIDGDCIIADDLELNGDNSNVTVKGNYYGYGYRTNDLNADDSKEADSNSITGFVSEDMSTSNYEHEMSSAIIVNAKGANLNMADMNRMILAGRAYIDLEDGNVNSANATYMTGESVALRGNQGTYLVDFNNLANIKDGDNILPIIPTSNPMKYSDFTAVCGDTFEIDDYKLLGIDSNYVVAKKVGDKVYFYNKQNDPNLQTQYFIDRFSQSLAVRNELKSQVSNLDVKNVTIGNSTTKIYTEGVINQVTNGNLVVPSSNKYLYGEQGITRKSYLNLVRDMIRRYNFITSSLKDYSTEYPLGTKTVPETLNTAEGSPYDTYVTNIVASIDDYKADNPTESYTMVEQQDLEEKAEYADVANILETKLHLDKTSENIGVVIIDNHNSPDAKNIAITGGIVIASGDIVVNDDFIGLIICGGTVTVNGSNGKNIDIAASKELVTALADVNPYVQKALGGYVSSSVNNATMVEIDEITYKNLVELNNWKRNSN